MEEAGVSNGGPNKPSESDKLKYTYMNIMEVNDQMVTKELRNERVILKQE